MAATLVSYSLHNFFFPTNNSNINIHRDWFPALVNTPSHDTKEEDVRAKKQSTATTKSLRLSCWIKPAFGWTKLNTDGSVREISGCGGLFRVYKGLPICSFISNALNNNIFIVELWAICKGLDVGLRLGIPRIGVESDSLSVVKTVNREQAYSLEATNYLRLVWDLMGKFERCHVRHAWRETDQNERRKVCNCCYSLVMAEEAANLKNEAESQHQERSRR
ncbi:hypothetical protein ACFX2I_019714 [Malus domestica]